MIVDTHDWRVLNILRYIGAPLLLLLGWDVVIAGLYVFGDQKWVAVEDLPTSLLGSALAIFISIRNNASYSRWWEARTLWGGVVNYSRSFARQIRLYLPGDPQAEALVLLQVSFAHALRCHLRRQDPWPEISGFMDEATKTRLQGRSNLPEAILTEIADRLAVLHQAGKLNPIQLSALDGTLVQLANMQGGTERIKNTPMPQQYRVFPRLLIELYCVLLPLAIVRDLGLATPLGSTALGFILLALEQIGRDLESPFEDSANDTPMTSITRTIEINLRDGLGHKDLPSPVKLDKGILW